MCPSRGTSQQAQAAPSLAQIMSSNIPRDSDWRDLIFFSNEDERKRRVNKVSATNIKQHMKQFFRSVMKMEPREIDASLHVQKTLRPHTVIVYLFGREIQTLHLFSQEESPTSKQNF